MAAAVRLRAVASLVQRSAAACCSSSSSSWAAAGVAASHGLRGFCSAASALPAAAAAAAETSLPTFVDAPRRRARAKSPLPLIEALRQVQAASRLKRRKFDETVEVAIKLGINPARTDQMVRGATTVPYGTGKTTRVAVFARGDAAEAALAAGAEVVGAEDLITTIKTNKKLDVDRCIATPDMMPLVGQVGTVTNNVTDAVANAKRGTIEFRTDKGGIVHAGIGKVSFEPEKLERNLAALASALLAARSKGAKGSGAAALKGRAAVAGFFSSIALSSTMGAGVAVQVPSFIAQALEYEKSAVAQGVV
eukprot:jgi/Chlat1/2655/Chrsp178S00159